MSRKDLNYHDGRDEIDYSKLDSSKVGPNGVEVTGVIGSPTVDFMFELPSNLSKENIKNGVEIGGSKRTINVGDIIEFGMELQKRIDDVDNSIDELNDGGNALAIRLLRGILADYRNDMNRIKSLSAVADTSLHDIMIRYNGKDKYK